jgi:N-acetylglutamate synthase-like GNAT family acetyltransferase
MAQFDVWIHISTILIEWNKILDIWCSNGHTAYRDRQYMNTLDRQVENRSAPPQIEIRALQPGEDGSAFRTLNEEWITRYFALEGNDREILGDPENAILRKGGHVFLVHLGGEAVGCVALIPMGDGVYELSKMAVSPRLRGFGIGRKLIEYAIAQAKMIGAKSLCLRSNTKLKNAVHLYESVGFHHVPPERVPSVPYTRANVFMEMQLGPN